MGNNLQAWQTKKKDFAFLLTAFQGPDPCPPPNPLCKQLWPGGSQDASAGRAAEPPRLGSEPMWALRSGRRAQAAAVGTQHPAVPLQMSTVVLCAWPLRVWHCQSSVCFQGARGAGEAGTGARGDGWDMGVSFQLCPRGPGDHGQAVHLLAPCASSCFSCPLPRPATHCSAVSVYFGARDRI